ncbi:glycosyl hydrolase [Paenibacillus puerhi]|uniref:glycosyl hydrolase n=1 Tax=Paenibacillus puerhi TaxID=2692622 RepID=UPI001F44F511|nr:glycosyl hydrolase [Paenibacillus puerhi]
MSAADSLRQRFDNPPAECRSAPFWGWNDLLEEQELVRQVEEMNEQGMGGFFIHSRDGLETEYMGREWMDLVRSTVDAAEANGMQAWLYDEDRWPSGFAGGLVQARGGDAFRAKGLTMEVLGDASSISELAGDSQVVALFKAVIDDRRLVCHKRLPLGVRCSIREGEAVLVFRVEISERSEWFNHEAPPDNLNPDTVGAFIDLTYEAYKREVGDRFGTTIRGVFTDEPSIHDRHCRFTPGRGWMPWSWSFPGFFKERRGYDLLDLAPYLFFDGELSSQARHDYWRTVTERFSEAYSKQIGQWCEDNGLAFTGHFLWENNMGTATRVCGAVMPNYRYQHVPGIDMLNEQTNEAITVKQCTSVANQYGRKHVLTETYGCTGWGFTFEGQKWIGDFQYALGVNVRSQHLALYSIRGCRKRDYPPVFNYNTSWWAHNRIVEDYFARLSAVLSEGRPIRDVLVLHPSSTAWSLIGTGPYGFPARGKDRDVSAVNKLGHEFNGFLQKLLAAHYDFDLGDETIMSETGSVRDGRLAVHLARYRVVVLPQIRTMLESTYRLLQEFLHAGGKAVAVGPPPLLLEGRTDERPGELYRHPNMTVVEAPQAAIAALEQVLPRRISIVDASGEEAPGFLYMLREAGDCRLLFLVNNDRNMGHEVSVTLEGHGALEEWKALTADKSEVELLDSSSNSVRFQAAFGPAESRLYVLHHSRQPKRSAGPPAAAQASGSPASVIELGPVCSFSRTAPNVLTLDCCSCRIGEESWSEETGVWQAQRAIREALGMRQVVANGLEQRYRWVHESHPANGTPAAFRFKFEVGQVPEREVYLIVESAEHYEITLNGSLVPNKAEGWFLDRAFDKVRLHGLRKGDNELVLATRYDHRMEVEDVYIIGDFAVDRSRRIEAESDKLAFGDWCLQGYPHYAGSMVYRYELEEGVFTGGSAILEIGDYDAVTLVVKVNGVTAGHVPWRSENRLDVGNYLQTGRNVIEIETVGSPRNMLGPFHQVSGDTATTSWASFRKEGSDYTPAYQLRPYGLNGSVNLYIRQE